MVNQSIVGIQGARVNITEVTTMQYVSGPDDVHVQVMYNGALRAYGIVEGVYVERIFYNSTTKQARISFYNEFKDRGIMR